MRRAWTEDRGIWRSLPACAGVAAFAVAVLLVLPKQASWAANAAFEGVWRIDLERSDPLTPQGLKIDNSYQLTLAGEDLHVVRTFYREGRGESFDWTLKTDGTRHEIPGLRAPRQARAKWRKDKLTVSYALTFDTQQGSFELDVTETWGLSKKGELEIRYLTRLPQGNQTRLEIYTPADEEGSERGRAGEEEGQR